METITTEQIVKANPGDTFTQRHFGRDEENYKYKLNVLYTTTGEKVARFFFGNSTTVALYEGDGKLVWRDWYSKYKAWEKNGEFEEIHQ